MSKEIDLIKCIISEIDNNLYSDFGGNPCISYTSDLKKLLLALDTPEVRHFFENYNKQDQRIAELKAENLSLQEQSIIDNQNYNEQLASLQQQLKEKDKEIKRLNNSFLKEMIDCNNRNIDNLLKFNTK